jgi:transcriptional regulator with XRE-family HTH domain
MNTPASASSATVDPRADLFGPMLRAWRRRRGASQLALALQSGVSQRHVSFLESGRARPSREMVVQLSSALDVPLRQRNTMLLAAGFAPVYRESGLGAPELAPVRQAIDRMLKQQEPYPAVVVDRLWNLLQANEAANAFTTVPVRGAAARAAAGQAGQPAALAARSQGAPAQARQLGGGRAAPRVDDLCRDPGRRRRAQGARLHRGGDGLSRRAGLVPQAALRGAALAGADARLYRGRPSRCRSSPPSPPWARRRTSPCRKSASSASSRPTSAAMRLFRSLAAKS